MGAVRFSIDSGLVRQLQTVLPLDVFVETGTYEGASVQAVLPLFEELHTIELSAQLYARAADTFAGNPKVHVHHGHSRDVLKDLIPKVRRKAILYWLDAHWCGDEGEHSEGVEEQCPLLDELNAIRSINNRSVVLVDDARLFMAPPPAPATTDGWPQLSQVLERLMALNSKHELLVIDDVFVFFPPAAREVLTEFARHQAVDWLEELQSSRRVSNQIDRLRKQVIKSRAERGDEERQRAAVVDKRIRNVASAIEALEAEVQRLAVESEKSRALLGDLPATLGRIPEVVEELGTAHDDVRSVGRRIDPLAAQLESIGAQVATFGEALQSLRRRAKASQEALAEFPEMREELQAIDKLFTPLSSELASLGTALENLENEVTAAGARSQESHSELHQRLGPVATDLESIGNRLESVSEAVADLPEARGAIQSLDERLDAQLQALGSRLEALQGDVKEVGGQSQESREALGERLDPMAARLEALGQTLGDLPEARDDIRSLASTVEELKGGLEPLHPKLEEGLGEQSERSAAALEQLEAIRGDLRSLEARLDEMGRRRGPLKAIAGIFGGRESSRREPAVEAAAAAAEVEEPVAAEEPPVAAEVEEPAPVEAEEPPVSAEVEEPAPAEAEEPVPAEAEAPAAEPDGDEPTAAPIGARLVQPDPHAPRPLRIPTRYRRVEPPEHAPRISIVTPSHSEPGFLDRTIRSVLEQGYEPLELIVEASESDKLAAELVERYRDELAHSEVHPNGNKAHAANLGFEHATGELMSYLSPDGMLLPGSLSYVARYFESHPDVDVVYGHVVLLDEDDFEVGRRVLPRHDDEVLSWVDYVPPAGLFWRRETWGAIGGAVDETLHDTFDWELMLSFREAGARIVRLPRFLAGLRVKVEDEGTTAAPDGGSEATRLRQRVHGRQVSGDEVEASVRGYERRHSLLQRLYRMHVLRY